MFAFAPWPPSVCVCTTPSQPVCWPRPWAWSSWPSWRLSTTSLQSTWFSGSVTVILYGMRSPNAWNWPSSGTSIVTVGRVLPAVIGITSKPLAPPASVTVSCALYVPAVVYVKVGLGSVESVSPSPSKSHA